MKRLSQLVRMACLALIRLYQLVLSPILGGACRYCPSCSEYTLQAVRRFGVVRGGWMGIKRIARCNPWVAGGYDPCPTDNKAGI